MKVKELIEILSRQDPELDIATHANNHTFEPSWYGNAGSVRVVMLTFNGTRPCIGIGNISRRQLNGNSPRVSEVLDGGRDIPENW